MSRLTTNRTLAAALLKTIKRLEDDPSVDPQDPAYIQLKCTLLRRLLSLEVDVAEMEHSLRLAASHVLRPRAAPPPLAFPDATEEDKAQPVVILRLRKHDLRFAAECESTRF